MSKKEQNIRHDVSLDGDSVNDKKSLKFSNIYPAFIVLFILIMISAFVFITLKHSNDNKNDEKFNEAIESVMTRLDNHTGDMLFVINSVSGVYDLVIEVVADFFMLYSTVPANSYEAITSIDYIQKVAADSLGGHIYWTQCDGYYDYKVFPLDTAVEFYYPIKHIVPFETSKQKQGFNLSTEPNINILIDKLSDSITTLTTDFYQTRPDTLGFYLCQGVYNKDTDSRTLAGRKKNFKGFIAVEINAEKFFIEALGGNDRNRNQKLLANDNSIIFQIYDIAEGERHLVFASDNANLLETGFDSYSKKTKPYVISDRILEIDFYTTPNFGGKMQNMTPLIILLGALVLSIAFFAFILSVVTSRSRALSLAERMTKSQRRIVDTSQDIIGALDMEGRWQSINQASESIFGFKFEAMEKTAFYDLVDEESEKQYWNIFGKLNNFEDESPIRVDMKMNNSKDEQIWMSWSLTISHADGLIYAIGRDTTIEKSAEYEATIRRKQDELIAQQVQGISESKTFYLIKLSHYLHNSLTSITGYLQLLKGKEYNSPEEMETFIKEMSLATETLLSYVTETVDGTIEIEPHSVVSPRMVNSGDVIKRIMKENSISPLNVPIEYKADNSIYIFATEAFLEATMRLIFDVLSYHCEADAGKIVVQGVVNTYENVAEIQITSPPSKDLDKLITIYKSNAYSIVEVLYQDKNDILFGLATINSNIGRMNGTVLIETFGPEDGSLIQITLPINDTNG